MQLNGASRSMETAKIFSAIEQTRFLVLKLAAMLENHKSLSDSDTLPFMAGQAGGSWTTDKTPLFCIETGALDMMKRLLKDGSDISWDEILSLPESAEQTMVPVDLSVFNIDADLEGMLGKLGPKGVVDGLVRGADYYEVHKSQLEADVATAVHWSELLSPAICGLKGIVPSL